VRSPAVDVHETDAVRAGVSCAAAVAEAELAAGEPAQAVTAVDHRRTNAIPAPGRRLRRSDVALTGNGREGLRIWRAFQHTGCHGNSSDLSFSNR
jgi:hypothetical protein